MSNGDGLPKGWATTSLGELTAEMCLGKMLDKNKNRGTLQPYLRNINVRWFGFDLTNMKEMRFEPGEEARFGLQSGDLVICEGGEPGRAAVWKGETTDARIQKALHRVRFQADSYDPSFALYYLFYGTITNRFARHYTGTTIKHLTGKALRQVPFPVPPANEQRRIVAKLEELLSDLDAGVAALQRVRANLKRYRASVLKSAGEGRLTEAWRSQNPPQEPASELLARILHQRRARWEQQQLAAYKAKGKTPPKGWRSKYREPVEPDTAGLPELPQGWCWASLAQVAVFQNGRAFPSKHYSDDGVRLLRPGNLSMDGSVKWTEKNTRRMPEVWAEDYPGYLVYSGELVMNLTAQSLADEFLGRTCMTAPDDYCLLNQRLARISPIEGLDARFTLYLLKSAIFRRFVNGLNTGSLIQHMFTSQLDEFVFPLPPVSEQKAIVSECDERLSIVDRITDQMKTNAQRAPRLRQSILKRAFEGKLVPQDPADEPAERLLRKIQAEKPERKAKKARKSKVASRK